MLLTWHLSLIFNPQPYDYVGFNLYHLCVFLRWASTPQYIFFYLPQAERVHLKQSQYINNRWWKFSGFFAVYQIGSTLMADRMFYGLRRGKGGKFCVNSSGWFLRVSVGGIFSLEEKAKFFDKDMIYIFLNFDKC